MKKGTKLQPAPAPQAVGQPAITVGLDLSDRNLHFCEIDADGEIIAESRIPLTAAALTAPPSLRGRTMGILGATAALSSVIGAPLAGALVDEPGWRRPSGKVPG